MVPLSCCSWDPPGYCKTYVQTSYRPSGKYAFGGWYPCGADSLAKCFLALVLKRVQAVVKGRATELEIKFGDNRLH